MSLQAGLDKLAQAVCDKAIHADTQLDQRIDALKALTTYYAVREKVKAKIGDTDDNETGTFDSFQEAIHAAGATEQGNGSTPKPPRSRPRVS